MIYKKFQDIELSALGLGMMRLPVKNGKNNEIDETATAEMIDYAINHGINYFDTAWGYHDGTSEIVAGKILSKYPREKYYLASKFPGYDLKNLEKPAEVFEKQLEKCRVDHFDFYLFHNVCEMNIDGYLDPKYGIYDYLMEQKRAGRIRHLGFSAHGNYDTVQRFLQAYGKDMEFCQLQINWLDWDFQDAKARVELVKSYGIPVWVMEPLRGGKLAVLSDEYLQKLGAFRKEESAPGWAFRFLQTLPEVCVTLSGMSNFAQLKENIEIFAEEKPLDKAEWDTLMGFSAEMTSKKTLACTSCRYCTTYCPQGLQIPELIKLYNEHRFTGGGFIAPMALSAVSEDKRPAACIGCRSCEAVCPQQIKIADMMADFTKRLGE